MNTQVLGISVDHIPCLIAWAESLGGINYPLLSDFWPHGAVANRYGVLRSEGYSERALFVLDKWGVIRYIDIHDIDLQPENEELFRVLRRVDPEAALNLIEEKSVAPILLCASGSLIVELLGALGVARDAADSLRCQKGSVWVLERKGGVIVRAEYVLNEVGGYTFHMGVTRFYPI